MKKQEKKVEEIRIKHGIFHTPKLPTGYKIAIGRDIISKMSFQTEEQADKYIDSKPWELLIETIMYINLKTKNNE